MRSFTRLFVVDGGRRREVGSQKIGLDGGKGVGAQSFRLLPWSRITATRMRVGIVVYRTTAGDDFVNKNIDICLGLIKLL